MNSESRELVVDNLNPMAIFVDRVTGAQQGLFAYILTLVSNVDDANDVLQETNMVLWRKREEYRLEDAFWPWARTIAHYQILAHSKRKIRDRLRFGPQLLARLAEESVVYDRRAFDAEQTVLGECVEDLPPSRRELVELRYSSGLAVAEIAKKTNRSPAAVSDSLYRIRVQLSDCVRNKLGAGEEKK